MYSPITEQGFAFALSTYLLQCTTVPGGWYSVTPGTKNVSCVIHTTLSYFHSPREPHLQIVEYNY